MRPQSGRMYYWRYKSGLRWHFGYCTYIEGQSSMIRMGRWNGDSTGGSVVSVMDIEWGDYA